MSKYDIYCRSCGIPMRTKVGKYGEYYQCPRCKSTMSIRDAALEDDRPNTYEYDWSEDPGSPWNKD